MQAPNPFASRRHRLWSRCFGVRVRSRLRVAARDASRGFVGMSAAGVFASKFSVEVGGMLASMPSTPAQPGAQAERATATLRLPLPARLALRWAS
jgi:hypothetical protein